MQKQPDIWHSTFDFYDDLNILGEPLPFDPDPNHLPPCECRASFPQFMWQRFANLFDYPTVRSLDEALRTVEIEYEARKKTYPVHSLNACLSETVEEIRLLLTKKRDELLRHAGIRHAPHLHI